MKFWNRFILVLFVLVTYSNCAQTDSTQVRNTCNNFIQGRINLRKNDSTLLKSVTEDSLFRLIMLHHKYAQMLNAPIVRADLRIHVKSVEVKDSCASCFMSGYERYIIKLCEYDGTWKVKGENDIYATSERLNKARRKIVDYKISLKERPAVDSVLTVVNRFFKDVDNYFKTQDIDSLHATCDQATIDLITEIYNYAKDRTGLDALHEEMDKPDFTVGDPIFESGRTLFKFYKEDIYLVLQKQNTNYIITGLNKRDSKTISKSHIADTYLDLLRAMRLTRNAKYRSKSLR